MEKKQPQRTRPHRVQLELNDTERDALYNWARRQGLQVSPALRALLYRQGVLEQAIGNYTAGQRVRYRTDETKPYAEGHVARTLTADGLHYVIDPLSGGAIQHIMRADMVEAIDEEVL